jgi:hypothetical protein
MLGQRAQAQAQAVSSHSSHSSHSSDSGVHSPGLLPVACIPGGLLPIA